MDAPAEPAPRRWTFAGPVTVVPGAAFERPVLVVVVDTEEEFDWAAPFDPRATGVTHMRSIGRFQDVCDEAGVRPLYVVDHPIASQPASSEPLRAIHARGACEIGAHLHPWVSPPVEEEIGARNSYPGNLPRALEREKLARLTATIEREIGVRPRAYKAGRYGFGANTAATLDELGYAIDVSACPPFDFAADGGPDWSRAPVVPWWLGPRRSILAIPCTGAYVGWAGGASRGLYALAQSPAGRAARLGGVLARTRAVERLMLTPEGHALGDMKRLTRALLARGVRVFNFTLHSPSVEPGHTPYVRSASELDAFLATCRDYFRWFLRELGGEARTPGELRARLQPGSQAADP